MYYDDFELTDLMIRRSLIKDGIKSLGRPDIHESFDIEELELLEQYLRYDLDQVDSAIKGRIEQLKEARDEEIRSEESWG